MEPVTLALLIFGVASIGLSLLGQHEEYVAGKEESLENEKLAKAAAGDALVRGSIEAGRARMRGSQLIGEQKVAYAASGVDIAGGTPLDVMTSTRMVSELDARTLESNAIREAWGYEKQQEKMLRQRKLDLQRHERQVAGTVLGGMGNLMGGFK